MKGLDFLRAEPIFKVRNSVVIVALRIIALILLEFICYNEKLWGRGRSKGMEILKERRPDGKG